MNNYKIIDNVLNATSAEALCGALRECQRVLKTRFTNKTAFMERLQDKIYWQILLYKQDIPIVNVLDQPINNISIYEDRVAYLMYSSFKLNMCTSLEELNLQITDIIDFFGNKMTKSKTAVLNIDEISSIFNIVQRKFNLLEVILRDKEFEIYLLDRSHICYDSFLLTFKNKYTGLIYKRWMLFSLSPCMDILACNKYFVFLHEIGHCFYNTIIQEDRKALDYFKEIAEIAGLPIFNDESRVSELYADIFAAASLKDTCYSNYNPFKNVLPENILELFELYFKMVIYQKNMELYDFKKEESLLN
jgi:hypothetical protein